MTDESRTAPVDTNRDFYDRISNAYDLLSASSEREAREAGEEALGARAGERVIEIGSGTGNTLLNLAERVGPEGTVVGLDVSAGMHAVAREKLERRGLLDRVQLIVGDAREIELDTDSCDAAFTSFTLELFEEDVIPDVLAEVRRILRPGGRLGVVCMAKVPDDEHESLLEKGYQWMHRHFPHIVDCAPIDVGPLLSNAGFELSRGRRLEMWTMPVEVVLAKAPR